MTQIFLLPGASEKHVESERLEEKSEETLEVMDTGNENELEGKIDEINSNGLHR